MEHIKKILTTQDREELLKNLSKDRALSAREASLFLNISLPSLRKAIKTGRIKSYKVGRFIKVSSLELKKLVNDHYVISVAEAANILGVTSTTIRELIKKNKIHAFRLAEHGSFKIPANEIERIRS